jgi:predicted hydrolase (HD superfamily)
VVHEVVCKVVSTHELASRARITAMSITYEQAQDQLNAWTKTDSLLKHARAVEIVMRQSAKRYGGEEADPERWAITGLLHDADYEQWPEEHPQRVVDWLKDRGEEEVAYAVSFHQTKWGLPPKHIMDKALLACDELAGFVIACSLVRPEGVATLTPKSVKKKLKDKAFAAKVDREIIRQGVELLGVDMGEHIQFVVDALKPHADELGIGPRADEHDHHT